MKDTPEQAAGKAGLDLQPMAISFSPPDPTTPDGEESSATARNSLRLNPLFAEWLMGWPIGWTGLRPLETASYRSKLRPHLRRALGG